LVWFTGGGAGIGRATALALAGEGVSVAVADLLVATAEETSRMIEDKGGKAFSIECDVSKAGDVEAMLGKTIEIYGRIDCAVNNAGIGGPKIPIVDYPEEEWNRVISINLTGVWLCMKHEIRQMLKQGGGAIVNMASVGGLVGTAEISAYIAAKHGVVGLTKTAALECAQRNIRVNAVCPGAIRTALVEEVIAEHPEVEKFFSDMHPIGRIGEAKEVAEAVVWLCSDAASFVTGSTVTADGGMTAQ
jgi:NAD(P)-dependent dehydrogenase (short-subunit alcohol dehydrogenase family)